MRLSTELGKIKLSTDERTLFPLFAQRLIDRGKFEGLREGEIKGKHDALLRLLARAGIELAEGECARILACADPETLDRWLENVLGAKTAAEVLSRACCGETARPGLRRARSEVLEQVAPCAA